MKLKKFILSALAIGGFAVSAMAQDIEGGIFLGTTEYQGDLSKSQVTFSQTKLSIGALGRYYFGPRFDLKAGIMFGSIEGDDKDYQGDRARRDLNFKSNIFEVSVQGELNILPFISNSKRYRFAPYVFAGVGVFHFNPTGVDPITGATVDLQPLTTEGEAKYSLWQMSIPYGVGIKYSLGHFWNIGLEVGQRKIFTDYLDDVSGAYISRTAFDKLSAEGKIMADPGYYGNSPSAIAERKAGKDKEITDARVIQRGNSEKEDMYLFAGITITKTLRRFTCTNF